MNDKPDAASVPTFRRIVVHDGTWLGARGRMVIGYFTNRTQGPRVQVHLWRDVVIGQRVERPAGTITYARVTGDGRYAEGDKRALRYIEPQRVITLDELRELHPELAERL